MLRCYSLKLVFLVQPVESVIMLYITWYNRCLRSTFKRELETANPITQQGFRYQKEAEQREKSGTGQYNGNRKHYKRASRLRTEDKSRIEEIYLGYFSHNGYVHNAFFHPHLWDEMGTIREVQTVSIAEVCYAEPIWFVASSEFLDSVPGVI